MTRHSTADPTATPAPEKTGAAPRRSVWQALRSGKTAAGLAIVGFFVLVAIVGPMIFTRNPGALSGAALQPPSGAHWFGTTQLGQDIFTQVVDGTRVSVMVGFLAALMATVLSLLVGLAAGYWGNLRDELLSALANIFLVIPALPLVVVLAGYLPSRGELTVALVISVTGWSWGARVLRAQTLSIRKRDFIEASRATGEGSLRIILWEILPNELAIVASTFLFTVIFAILTQAGLAFLGLADVTSWSWGAILYWAENNQALQSGAWWWFLPPGLCIALFGTGLAMMNFGIDEFVNPRLRVARRSAKEGRRAARRDGVDNAITPVASERSAAPVLGSDVVLQISNLRVDYGYGASALRAVDDVSLTLHRGEVLGIAGESGSGKSTLAYAITRLLRAPGRVVSGEVYYGPREGQPFDVLQMTPSALKAFRWSELAIVFQSAMNALNPILSLRAQLADALDAHRPGLTAAEQAARVDELFKMVGISADRGGAYPHELSGGMRQRAMIAMALVLDPEIIVMDEPTTALDVVIQRQILRQIVSLRREFGFAVVFITHDLSLLLEIADTIAVMYAGKVVEVAGARELYQRPRHPYSRGLLQSFPLLRGPRAELTGIPGSPPDLRERLPGCPFQPRCGEAVAACTTVTPVLAATGVAGDAPDRQVACLLYDEHLPDRPEHLESPGDAPCPR